MVQTAHREAHAIHDALQPLPLSDSAQPFCAGPGAEVVRSVPADSAKDGRVGPVVVWPFAWQIQAYLCVLLCSGNPIILQYARPVVL